MHCHLGVAHYPGTVPGPPRSTFGVAASPYLLTATTLCQQCKPTGVCETARADDPDSRHAGQVPEYAPDAAPLHPAAASATAPSKLTTVAAISTTFTAIIADAVAYAVVVAVTATVATVVTHTFAYP